jgi:hypothetical protein
MRGVCRSFGRWLIYNNSDATTGNVETATKSIFVLEPQGLVFTNEDSDVHHWLQFALSHTIALLRRAGHNSE